MADGCWVLAKVSKKVVVIRDGQITSVYIFANDDLFALNIVCTRNTVVGTRGESKRNAE